MLRQNRRRFPNRKAAAVLFGCVRRQASRLFQQTAARAVQA